MIGTSVMKELISADFAIFFFPSAWKLVPDNFQLSNFFEHSLLNEHKLLS